MKIDLSWRFFYPRQSIKPILELGRKHHHGCLTLSQAMARPVSSIPTQLTLLYAETVVSMAGKYFPSLELFLHNRLTFSHASQIVWFLLWLGSLLNLHIGGLFHAVALESDQWWCQTYCSSGSDHPICTANIIHDFTCCYAMRMLV